MGQILSQLGSGVGQGVGALGSGIGQGVGAIGSGLGQGLGGLVGGLLGHGGAGPGMAPPAAGAAGPNVPLMRPQTPGMDIAPPPDLPQVSSALPQLAGVNPRSHRAVSIDPKRLAELGELLRQSTPPPTGAGGPRLSAGGAGDGMAQIAAGMRASEIMSRMPRDPRNGRRIPLGALPANLRQG